MGSGWALLCWDLRGPFSNDWGLQSSALLLGAERDVGYVVQGMVKMAVSHPAASVHPHYISVLQAGVGMWGEGELREDPGFC